MARAGLADAARVARWADAALGRGSATADGKATLSDATADRAARELGLTAAEVRADWDTARLAGLIEVHGDSARPGWRLRAWNRDDSAVLRGWVALFDAWSLAHPEPAGQEPAAVAEVVSAMPQLLSFLQLSAGPVPVAQLLDLLEQRVTELRTERCEVPYGPRLEPGTPQTPEAAAPAPDTTADTPLAPLLDWALHALASVGALTCGDGHATLTPLGSWAVWVKLEQICVAAQSPAGNIEQSAEDMLRGCARLRPNAARAEYRAWLAARPVGSAVAELIAAARGEDALLRGLAFDALRVVGAPAEPDVRAVVDEPTLRPYALLWLAEHDGADPEDAHEVLTRREATWLWVDNRRRRRRPRRGPAARAAPGVRGAAHRAGPPRRGPGGRTPAHRAGPGRARRRTPRPRAGEGRAPSGVPGAHRGQLRGPAGRGGEPRSGAQAWTSGAYVPKLQMFPSRSRAM